MTEANTAAAERPKLSIRAGSSRKLLARKAMEKAGEGLAEGEALDASFPTAEEPTLAAMIPHDASFTVAEDNSSDGTLTTEKAVGETCETQTDLLAGAVAAVPTAAVPGAPPAPAPMAPWSGEDESTLQALLARRKAAGYQHRGRDVSGQLITVGSIKPNPETVVAVIVGIVAEQGSVGRAELIKAMAGATFAHAKAQPSDKGWCQGYVAGALRNGFLRMTEQPAVAADLA